LGRRARPLPASVRCLTCFLRVRFVRLSSCSDVSPSTMVSESSSSSDSSWSANVMVRRRVWLLLLLFPLTGLRALVGDLAAGRVLLVDFRRGFGAFGGGADDASSWSLPSSSCDGDLRGESLSSFTTDCGLPSSDDKSLEDCRSGVGTPTFDLVRAILMRD
jgi:hypothetical protein